MRKQDQDAPEGAPTTSETIELLLNRVSVRKYDGRPVGEETLKAVLEAAFRSPTSSNIQAYGIVVVSDRALKEKLSAVAGGQKHVRDAPVFLAFCADLTRIEAALQKAGHAMGGANLELGLVASIDVSLVGMSVYLAADSLGLKGVMIGGLRNDASETARILELPRGVYCVFGMCLGWPAETPPQKPRMDFSQMVHFDRYGALEDERPPARAMADYDAGLKAHYTGLGKETAAGAWSDVIGGKFHPQPRPDLAKQLKQQGFDFN